MQIRRYLEQNFAADVSLFEHNFTAFKPCTTFDEIFETLLKEKRRKEEEKVEQNLRTDLRKCFTDLQNCNSYIYIHNKSVTKTNLKWEFLKAVKNFLQFRLATSRKNNVEDSFKRGLPHNHKDLNALLKSMGCKFLPNLDVSPQKTKHKPFGAGHPMYDKEKSKRVPVSKEGNIATWLMACQPENHWSEPEIDNALGTYFWTGQRIGSLLAATACGKTSAVQRALSKDYGLYLTCSRPEEKILLREIVDRQMIKLVESLQYPAIEQEEVIALAPNYVQLAIIARLHILWFRTTNHIRDNKSLPSPEQFLMWQINVETEHFCDSLEVLIRKTSFPFLPHNTLAETAISLSDELALLLGRGKTLPFFIDEAHVYGLPDTLNGNSLVTNNGTTRLGGLISILIQSILSGAGSSRSLLIFGTAMKVDLGEIISSCGGGQGSKGAKLKFQRHVGHSLIKTPEEAIELLEISFTVPPELAKHINSVAFLQYFPLRRRFFSSMLIHWDEIFQLNRGKKKTTPAKLAAGTDMAKIEAIESLVDQTQKFLDLKEHHRFSLAQLEYLSYNAGDSYFLESFADKAREDIQTSLLTTGLCSYSSMVHDEGSRQFVQFVTNEYVTRGVLRTLTEKIATDVRAIHLKESLSAIYRTVREMKSSHCDIAFGLCLRLISLTSNSISEWPFFEKLPNKFPPSIDAFRKSKERGIIHGVISGKSALLIHLSEVYNQQKKSDRRKIDILANYLRGGAPEQSPAFALCDPSTGLDGAVFYILENNLEHIISGFVLQLSVFAHADGVALVKLNESSDRFEKYGWIFFAHKLLETSIPQTANAQTKMNVDQSDSNKFYLQLARCAETSQTPMRLRGERKEAPSVFEKSPVQKKQSALFRKLLNRFKNKLPIAVTLTNLKLTCHPKTIALMQGKAILLNQTFFEEMTDVKLQQSHSTVNQDPSRKRKRQRGESPSPPPKRRK